MHRHSMNQDNERIGGTGYGNLNRGYEEEQHDAARQPFRGHEEDRYGSSRNASEGRRSDRSMSGYRGSDRSMSDYHDYRDEDVGFGGSYSGYRGTDDRAQPRSGSDDRGVSERGFSERGFSGYDRGERHPHDEHERGRWGTDHSGQRGHHYQGGIIDDDDRYRREEARYQSHESRYEPRDERAYDRTGRSGGFEGRGYEGRGYEGRGYEGRGYEGRGYEGRGYEGRGYEGRGYEGRGYETRYQDRDQYGRFAAIEDRNYDMRDRMDRDYPGYASHYGRDERPYRASGYGRQDRDEQRYPRDDYDRRWVGGGYEEDRRGRGRGR